MAVDEHDQATSKTRPNIVIIVSDQHNRGVMGCAGDSVVRTPNLDRLAAQGVRFANTYCGSPLCVPSRMSFLTGQYPSDIAVWTNSCLLASDVPTFAHALSLANYETVLCGRMHFTGPDQHHGFARRLVGDVSGARADSRPLFEGQIPVVTTGQTAPGVKVAGPGRSTYIAYDDDVADRACQYLRERDDEGNTDPFCLVVGMLTPHSPYICPRALYDEYFKRVELPSVPPGYLETLHPAMQHWRQMRAVATITPEEAHRARAAYYGLVSYLDQRIGEVLNTLAATRFGEETIVIYLSDHGDMAGEHGMWWKSSLYEGSVAVPMIWSWPGNFPAGRVETTATSLLDVGTTLLELTHSDPLPHDRGQSLAPFLSATESTARVAYRRDPEFAEIFTGLEPPARMIRSGPWKLIHYYGHNDPQLFHLAQDPDEFEDLGRSANYAAVREELQYLVQEAWSAERIEETVAHRSAGQQLVRAWQETVTTGESERWHIPDGCNLFPDSRISRQ